MNQILRQGLFVAAIASVSLVLGGCKGIRQIRELRPDGLATLSSDFLPIQGEEITASRRTAVDVENLNGSVTILVSDRYKKASVYARANWHADLSDEEWKDISNERWVVAQHVEDGENSVLRVLSQAAPDMDPPVRTEIKILMPACDGVFVRNAGGNVTVVGAGGAHTIASGFELGSGGHIEVRTGRAISDPINLRTSNGAVNLVLAPNSGGLINVQTDDGRVAFGSKYGRLTNVHVEEERWTGTWNGQSNPILLQTLDGDARLRVEEKPEMFSTGLRW